MKLIWNEEDFPELAGQTLEDKRAILRAAKKARLYRRGALALVAFGNFFLVAGAGVLLLVSWNEGNAALWLLGLVIVGTLVNATLRSALIYQPLRDAVAEVMKHPPQVSRWSFCHACNYDLRGSPGAVCPECGATIGNDRTGWGEV